MLIQFNSNSQHTLTINNNYKVEESKMRRS